MRYTSFCDRQSRVVGGCFINGPSVTNLKLLLEELWAKLGPYVGVKSEYSINAILFADFVKEASKLGLDVLINTQNTPRESGCLRMDVEIVTESHRIIIELKFVSGAQVQKSNQLNVALPVSTLQILEEADLLDLKITVNEKGINTIGALLEAATNQAHSYGEKLSKKKKALDVKDKRTVVCFGATQAVDCFVVGTGTAPLSNSNEEASNGDDHLAPDAPLVEGDTVVVFSGKYKNKRGTVASVSPRKCSLSVDGKRTGDLLLANVGRVVPDTLN